MSKKPPIVVLKNPLITMVFANGYNPDDATVEKFRREFKKARKLEEVIA